MLEFCQWLNLPATSTRLVPTVRITVQLRYSVGTAPPAPPRAPSRLRASSDPLTFSLSAADRD